MLKFEPILIKTDAKKNSLNENMLRIHLFFCFIVYQHFLQSSRITHFMPGWHSGLEC